ncbi:MAG: hypothetical protein M1835_008061 [Candelina submexicana]|nr:MAG: hypothetical protein M1835_008061 [Candelina submexicana]
MVRFSFAASSLILATITTAAIVPKDTPGTPNPTNAKAIYVLDNEASNSVLAFKINDDGTVSDGIATSTGGFGCGKYPSESAADGALHDSHIFQGSLGLAGNVLVAVNPGSNQLSLFTIDEQDATKLTLVGEPADSRGDFPVSVAVSEKLKQACVANTGSKASIACFSIDAVKGIVALDESPRSFDLSQSTPPTSAASTFSEVFFNDDASALIVTVKGDRKNNAGYVSVFPISKDGVISTEAVKSSPQGTSFLCGATTIPGTNTVLITDPLDSVLGAVIVSVDSATFEVVTVAVTHIGDNNATTNAAFSASTGSVFVSDDYVNHLVEIDPKSGAILNDFHFEEEHAGFADLTVAGKFLYALEPAEQSTIAVVDVVTGKEVQHLVAKGLGLLAQGLAVLA